MHYTPSYPVPSLRDESYILMTLAIGTAKRCLSSLNTLAWFEEKEQDKILDFGEKLLQGKTTEEAYLKEFESVLKKYTDEKLPSIGKQQIIERLKLSNGSKVKEEKALDKESSKKITKQGTIKEGRINRLLKDIIN